MTNTYARNGIVNFNNPQTFNSTVTINSYMFIGYDNFSPNSGDTVTITKSYSYINASGTLAALTINLPASPGPGQEIEINSNQIVTALTISGGTLLTSVTALAVDTPIRLMYESNTSKWVKR